MTFQLIFAIVRARWILASSIFLLVLTTAVVYTWLVPKSYTASASIIIDIKGQDPIAGMTSPALASPAYLMTQVDVINSSRVALKVVRNLKLNELGDMRAKWQSATGGIGDFEGWLATLIKSNMEARPSRGSNVIYVTYQAADPQFAAVVANGFVQAYLETTLDLRTAPAKLYNDFFDANARQLRSNLEAAQTRLSGFQQKEGLLVNDERLDVETARLNELSSQYVITQSAVADSGSRQAAARVQGDRSPDVINNPLVSSLQAELNRQEAALEQMTTRLGDQHPQVLEAKNGIAEVRRKLDAEVRRVTASVGVGNTVNVSRAAQIKVALEEQRAKVLKMKAIRDEAALLQRDVDNAQRAYDNVIARMGNTSLESQVNQANISALEVAKAPSNHSSPRVLTNVAAGFLIGLILAVVLALLVEHADRRLRSQDDMEALFQQALIGTVPSFPRPKQKAQKSGLRGPMLKALTHKAA